MRYSVDFKKKVMEFAETHTVRETSETFKISTWTVSTWRKQLRDTGNLDHYPIVRKPRKLNYEKLIEYVNANPDKYLREIAEEFNVSQSAIGKTLRKLKITSKKRPNYTKSVKRKNVRSMQKKYLNTIKMI
jgi:transposase